MKPWYKKWWAILLMIMGTFILIFIIASGFYIFDIIKKIRKDELTQRILLNKGVNEKKLQEIEGDDNYWIGSANPKVTIVEFGDFACPICQKSFSKVREISLKYRNNVKIIYRDFPLQTNSLKLAMAGRCAGEQGLFWLMHDKLFQNQNINSDEKLIDIANQIGANTEKFTNCLINEKYLADIDKDFIAGQKLEITGTPTWFINGYKIEGDIPYSLFIDTIEKLIQIK